MVLGLGVWDYVIISLMLSVSAAVGLYFRFTGGRQKTTHEFLMAGKEMSVLPVAFSLMATYMSAISVLGIPSDIYMYGSQFSLWLLGTPIGAVISAYMFLPVFFDMEAATAYEYLERRFGKTTRAIASVMFTIQMIFYMAVVLYAPSLALNAVTGLSTWGSIITLAVVCTFYCSLGGLKAVLWTDVFQAMLMYITLLSVVIKGTMDIGGIEKSITIAKEGGRLELLNISSSIEERYTFWNALLSGIVFSLSTFGTNQAQIQRMLSVRSLKQSRRALFVSVPLIMIFTFLCCWDGVVIYSLYHDCDPVFSPSNTTIYSADQLMPYAVLNMFHEFPGLSGLCVAGIFSASLSTISSAVNSLTAVTMEDFIRPYCFCRKLTESWATFLAKVIAVGYGGLCLLLTLLVANFRGVLEASNILFGMLAGPLLGAFSLGIFTITANEEGTLIGLLFGFVLNAWMGFGSYNAGITVPRLNRTVEGCYNFTKVISNETQQNSDLAKEQFLNENYEELNRDIFPLYKVAFLWFPIFGTVTTLIIGYICSLIFVCMRGKQDVKEEYVSPIVRRWFFDSKDNNLKHDLHIELSDTNGHANIKSVGSITYNEEPVKFFSK